MRILKTVETNEQIVTIDKLKQTTLENYLLMIDKNNNQGFQSMKRFVN